MKIFTKLLTLIFTLFITSLYSQSKYEADEKLLTYYKNVFESYNSEYKTTNAPEEWKSESIVYLTYGQYFFVNPNQQLIKVIKRSTALLQDDIALEDFSEFYFSNEITHILSLVKKNGTRINIDLQNAIKVTTEVPKKYRDRLTGDVHFKLAIPNLEKGDIIDHTEIFEETISSKFSTAKRLNSDSPILNRFIILDTDEENNMTINTFNTTQKCVKAAGKGLNKKGEVDKSFNRYTLKMTNLQAVEEEPFYNIYANDPILKINLIGYSDIAYLSKEDNPRKNESVLDLERILFTYFKAKNVNKEYFYTFSGEVYNQIKKRHKDKSLKTEQLIDLGYYYFREKITEPNKPISFNNLPVKIEFEKLFSPYDQYMNEQIFLFCFADILTRLDVKGEVVALIPDYIGKMENTITLEEITFGVYIPSLKKYYWVPSKYRNHHDVPTEMAYSASGIAIDMESKADRIISRKITRQALTSEFSVETDDIYAKLLPDNKLNIAKTVSYKGYRKNNYTHMLEQYGYMLYEDLLEIDKENENYKNELADFENYIFKGKKDYTKYYDHSIKEQTKFVESFLKEEGHTIVLDSFEILQSGRVPIKPEFRIQTFYNIDNYVTKLGPNLTLNIGQFIGSQITIDDKYKTNRKYDVDLGGSRQIINNITFEIPQNYTLDNVNSLNKELDNAFVSFKSSAILEGNLLKVTTRKEYKQNYAPKTSWPDILAMLDLAHNFSQEKIILKKK